MQSYSNGPGHMTNMAYMVKTYKNQADGLETWYVAYNRQDLPIFRLSSWVDLDLFTVRANMILCSFIWQNATSEVIWETG